MNKPPPPDPDADRAAMRLAIIIAGTILAMGTAAGIILIIHILT